MSTAECLCFVATLLQLRLSQPESQSSRARIPLNTVSLTSPRPVSDAPLGGSSLPKDHGSESFFVPQNKTKKGLCTEMLLEEEDTDCRNVSLSKKHDFLLDCGVVLVSEHELKNHSDGRTVVS